MRSSTLVCSGIACVSSCSLSVTGRTITHGSLDSRLVLNNAGAVGMRYSDV